MKKILRKKEVREITGLSDTTLWRLGRDDSSFPRPLRLGGAVGWLQEEIEKWIDEKAAERVAVNE